MTLEKTVDGKPFAVTFEAPDGNLEAVIAHLEADADRQAGRTPAQGVEARRASNDRADAILLERAIAEKNAKKRK